MMSIENVTIKKKANIYHDGRVTSRSIITQSGEMKTLGVMLPGTYRFNTQGAEVIDITFGSCRVRIGNHGDWQEYQQGESFEIPANSQFEIEISEIFDYVCHFN